MKSTISDYMSVGNFAKQYRTKGGKTGVRRQYIYQLIAKEQAEPNSTDIDILEVDGVLFCRYRIAKARTKV